MEFPFNINLLFRDEITLIRNKDICCDSYHYRKEKTDMQFKQNLSKVIDSMGAASSQAQKLRGAITSSFKLQSSDHHLYLIKDQNQNNGLGAVIGIIRVGFKRLFLVDIYGQQHECRPLCVLDFYIHETKQRIGIGKHLFEYMIKNENVQPCQLAIDRPSPKFIGFLAKHCSLYNPISQMNKFVVFESFFKDLAAVSVVDSNRRRSAPGYRNRFMKNVRPESRNALSATVTTSRNNPDRTYTNELSKFKIVPPVSRTNNSTHSTENIQLDTKTSLLSSRPHGSYSIRKTNSTNDSGIRNYSRHSIKQGATSFPVPSQTKSHVDMLLQNARIHQNNTTTHTLLSGQMSNSDRNLTSLDSPFSNTPIEARKETTKYIQDNEENYSVHALLDKLNANKQTLGTNWNVFGVPVTSQSSNPYSKMQRRGFPS